MMYEQGIGVGKDEQEAVAWYGESAALGSSDAQFNLGVLYENRCISYRVRDNYSYMNCNLIRYRVQSIYDTKFQAQGS